MATGGCTYFWPNEAGCADSPYGTLRLAISESWDDEANTSTLSIKLQVYSTYSGQWRSNGIIKFNDETIIANNQAGTSAASNTWANVFAVAKNNLPHDGSGKLKVKIDIQQSGYSRFALINQLNTNCYIYLTNADAHYIELHANDVGSAAYINGEKYDIYINGADGWEKFDAYIGNGREWGRY